jgi:hypothetical protein
MPLLQTWGLGQQLSPQTLPLKQAPLQQTWPGLQQLPAQQTCVLAQHTRPHACWPGIGQVTWPHFPLEQVSPGGHACPQPPQLFGSANGLVQTPLQQVKWTGLPVGPGTVQELPQAPQLFVSVCSGTQTLLQQALLAQHCPPQQTAGERQPTQPLGPAPAWSRQPEKFSQEVRLPLFTISGKQAMTDEEIGAASVWAVGQAGSHPVSSARRPAARPTPRRRSISRRERPEARSLASVSKSN